MINPTKAEQIATAFCTILHEWLPAKKLQRIVRLNALETDPRICHSHDFCDSNVAMDEAFKRVLGHSTTDTGGEGIGCMS